MAGPESALDCSVPSLFDLAPGGVCRAAPVTSRAVRSYRTLSPFAGPKPWRFALCGTFPEPVRRPARRTLSGTVISVEPGLSSPGRIPHRRRSPDPLARTSIGPINAQRQLSVRVERSRATHRPCGRPRGISTSLNANGNRSGSNSPRAAAAAARAGSRGIRRRSCRRSVRGESAAGTRRSPRTRRSHRNRSVRARAGSPRRSTADR